MPATFDEPATERRRKYTGYWIAALMAAVMTGGMAHAGQTFPFTHNDPAFREKAPPAVFPNQSIPPKYPSAKPQTHGLDLSRHDWETAKAYFKWLCDNEAGEFIYKTVDNVDSVFEMRRRPEFYHGTSPVYDRYYLEDPWGSPPTSGNERLLTVSSYSYVMPSDYRISAKDPGGWRQKGDYFRYLPEFSVPVLERVATALDKQRYGDAPYIRYTRVWPSHPEYDRDANGNIRMFQERKYLNVSRDRAKSIRISDTLWSPDRKVFDEGERAVGQIIPKVEAVHQIKSRYGFMWRGIERSPHDRELGIGGGEVLVFDLKTNEVLAVRRNFRLSGTYEGTRNVNWLQAQQCLKFDHSYLHKKVLKPIDPYKHLKIK